MSYLEILKVAMPEMILVVTVLVVLSADLLSLGGLDLRFRALIGAMISSAGCLAAIGWMLALPQQANLMDGLLVLDPLNRVVKIALLGLTVCALVLSIDADFTPHMGEYFALVLLAAIGMIFLVSAQDILMIFLSLELTSLSLYVLTAFNKRSRFSAEAALKYFLFGGLSAAVTLFGLSLLYGLSGATSLAGIGAAIQGPGLDPLLALAIVMTVIGFGFKVAAAPFHLWAPDTYEGAPVPSAAFIASASKVAGFFIFARVMMLGFKGAEGSGAWHAYVPGWVPVLAIVAAVSMVLGNLAAIVQSSVRRLLAYSAIAHAGYMLLGVMSHSMAGMAALVYYVVTYGLATLGAFGVVSVVKHQTGGDTLADFAGLGRRAPLLAFAMLIFMLSLAGIPPLAGFFGKFYLFSAALATGHSDLGLLWLVVLALAMSAVSLYYYLQVLKRIYVTDAPGPVAVATTPVITQVLVTVLALGVVLLGFAPNSLVQPLTDAVGLMVR
ncbi:MAG TPA: NADH-quinone oxidoreductase subunit N [Verrucomicrobiae bacterium]|nr:NADH-quinone oxidoreductase subunit N [Verrucomicrobiae bacterium]